MRNHLLNARRTGLVTAIVSCLLTAAPAAMGGNMNGGSATVGTGDPKEAWTLTNNATLNVVAGGITDTVQADASTVIITDGAVNSTSDGIGLRNGSTGTFTRATINSGSRALQLQGGTVATTATLTDSDVVGNSGVGYGAVAATVNNSSLIIASTRITDSATSVAFSNSALGVFGGAIALTAGSSATGYATGAWIYKDSSLTPTDRLSLTVSDSTLKGTKGAAILVGGLAERYTTAADILIEKNANLISGNGRLLEVNENSSAVLTIDDSRLSGGLVVLDTSRADVVLQNNAALTGYTTNVTSMSLSNASWQLTEDSDVGQLTMGNGATVSLGDGSAFNTLTVRGNYTSNNGNLIIHSVLGDDASPGDRLVVQGDTAGNTNVSVINVGGAGAQTVNGIQVVQVDGASNGTFALAGRAVGGLYDYFLFKGSKTDPNDGDWYLRSELQTPTNPCLADPSLPGCEIVIPDPCEIDPSLPQCGPIVPVLRPEPGAYLANLRAAEMMFRTDYHNRHNGQNHGRAWARVDGNRNSYDALNRQLDITGNSQALHVGLDLLTNEAGSGFGVMFASGNATSTTRSHLTDYSARGKVKGEALGVYGTIRALAGEDPYGGLYVDGWVQRQQFRNKVEGAGLSVERYDSKAWQGAVEAGYAFRLSGDPARGGIYLEPQIQVGYTDISSDTHVEENGTIVDAQEAGGMFARTGLRLSGVKRWEGMAAQVQPYLQANWLYNKRDEALLFDNELVDNRIPASKLEIGAGASIKFAGGFGVWAGMAVQSASGYRSTSGQMGLNYSW